MAQRSGSAIINQVGVETTPGVGGTANRILPTLSLNPSVKSMSQKFRAQGNRTTSATARHKNFAEGDYEGVLDYNSSNYLFDGLFAAAAPAQIGSLIAYQRDWAAGVTTLDAARKTFVIETGDATAANRFQYAQLQSLTLESTQEDMNVKGSLIAQYPTINTVLTAAPTRIAERPVQRGDINFYLDTTAANIGTTQLTEVQREMISIGEKFIAAWFHNRSVVSWSDTVEKDYEAMLEFTLSHNAPSRSLLNELITNPRKYIRYECQGRLLGTNVAVPIYELIRIDMAVDFDEPEEIKDSEGIYAYKYKCTLVSDTALGSHFKVRTISSLATL